MTTRTLSSVACAAGLLLAAGCVMPDQMSQLQQDVSDVRKEVQALKADQDQTKQQLAQIELLAARSEREQQPIGREEMATLGVQIEQLSRRVRESDERINDVYRRLDDYSQELSQTRRLLRAGTAVPPGDAAADGLDEEQPVEVDAGTVQRPAPPQPPPARPEEHALPDPEALYNTAYTDFSKGNYSLAIAGFEEYHKLFPESALADNALYWIGECHFSQGDYDAAVEAFDNLLELHPRSDKAAAGNLKKALAFLELNQVGTAIVQLRYVVSNYPGTDEARIAEDKLDNLGAETH